MNRVSPRRSRKRPFFLSRARNPEADRDLRRVEELAGQRDHAIDEVGLDDRFADLAFAGLVRRHRAVGEHKTGGAGRGQVMDEMLHPGEIGVAGRWGAEDPALIAAQ